MKKLIFFAFFSIFLLSMSDIISAQETGTGLITGKLMIKDGGPMSGGKVFFFNDASGPPPSKDKYWRVPDHMATIDNEGRFSAELHAGKYYFGAIKRISGRGDVGPPGEGDLFFASSDGKGMPKAYTIRSGEKTDVGVMSEAIPFKRATVKWRDGITAIEGVILDADGKPVEGALVFAYTMPTMVGRPVFASERSDREGKYILRVHAGGKYYLKVRDVYGGGPPVSGAVICSYDQAAPVDATVRTGEITKGINIKVIRFPGRGPAGSEQQNNRKQ